MAHTAQNQAPAFNRPHDIFLRPLPFTFGLQLVEGIWGVLSYAVLESQGFGVGEGVLREALNLNLKPENGLGMFMVKGPKP